MSDILKVSTNINQHDNSSRVRNVKQDNQILNTPDPKVITKSGGKDGDVTNQNTLNQKAKSNFDAFLGLIRENAAISDTFGSNVLFRLENFMLSDLDPKFLTEIKNLSELMKMSKDELMVFLKSQFTNSSKYNLEFFDILRNAFNKTNSRDLKFSILELMKKFDSLTSTNHINKNILETLKTIQSYMPKSYADDLGGLMKELSIYLPNGEISGNLAVLKKNIYPFLGRFVKQTNNFGTVRDFITLLSVNIARFENGDKNSFLSTLNHVLSFNEVRDFLDISQLDNLKNELLNYKFQNDHTPLIDKFIGLISDGIDGKAGYMNKATFQNVMASFLLNESVYMPIMHLILPANIGGKMMFSEIWVDPQAKNNTSQGVENDVFKFFVKFDIKDIGFFEFVLLYKNNVCDMQIYVPKAFKTFESKIKKDFLDIATKNQMEFRTLSIEELKKPKSVAEVFPKIVERKTSINVSI